MWDRKILLILFLIFLIPIFSISVLARFTGQHVFISGQTIVVSYCKKCHADVYDEMASMSIYDPHAGFRCDYCHIWKPEKFNYKFHAAATIECLLCHSPSGGSYDATNIFGKDEAHAALVQKANETGYLRGVNEACIACHTHAGKVIVTEYRNFTINANPICNETSCDWNISIRVLK